MLMMGEGGDGTRSAPLEMKWETRVALRPAADRVFIDQPAAGDRRQEREAGWQQQRLGGLCAWEGDRGERRGERRDSGSGGIPSLWLFFLSAKRRGKKGARLSFVALLSPSSSVRPCSPAARAAL